MTRDRLALLWLILAVGAAACGDDPGLGDDGAAPEDAPAQDAAEDLGAVSDAAADAIAPTPYSIVVLPDTQYYAMSWPEIFDKQTTWIVGNKDTLGIKFVLHVGDIVDQDVPLQWMNANRSLSKLDGHVPYLLTAGNHDYTTLLDRMGMAASYFPVSRLAQSPTFGGTFEAGHVENNYSLLPAGGGRWLVLALEFGPRDEVLTWADGILKKFADVPAMIVTHAYLYAGNVRYDHNGPHQSYTPHDYFPGAGQMGSSINDGEEIWQKLIKPNRNVQFVFSGHVVGDGQNLGYAAARLTSTRDDGSRVHQILANYQSCLSGPCAEVRGGNGFLRILRFSPAEHIVHVQTYSPDLNQSLTDDANQFDLELP